MGLWSVGHGLVTKHIHRRPLIVPWTVRRSNQSVQKEINPEYSLEGLMLKLKFQNFGYRMWSADSLEKTLMLGKIEGKRRERQRMRWLDRITDSVDLSLNNLRDSEGQESLVCCSPKGHKESDMTEQLNTTNNSKTFAAIFNLPVSI